MYPIFVRFPRIKPEKSGFHPISQEDVKNGKPNKDKGNLTVELRWHYGRIQGKQQKGKHPGQHRSKAINECLLEEFPEKLQLGGH